MRAVDVGDEPLPEGERLRVWVVDAEDSHSLLHPEPHRCPERLPQLPPLLALEVERDDVLVFLGRILRVLDRAVGPVAEPLGVLADPWMVGRALHREVKRQFDAEGFGPLSEPLEVVERA